MATLFAPGGSATVNARPMELLSPKACLASLPSPKVTFSMVSP